ncbi:MAG: hypothetical protein AAF530_07710 [Pseudomonadota bacterium]
MISIRDQLKNRSDRRFFSDLKVRWLLAGPGALLGAIVVMSAMPIWFPKGAAEIDHLIFPLILFPAIWALLFFYSCLTEDLIRACWIFGSLIVINVILVLMTLFWP